MPQKIGMVKVFNNNAIKSLPPPPVYTIKSVPASVNNRRISMTTILRQPAGTCAPCGH